MDNFPERVTLFEDGAYRWHYDMDMWKNRYFILRLMRILCLCLGIPMLFVVAMHLKTMIPLWRQGASPETIEFFTRSDRIALYVVGGLWLGCMLLALIIYVIAALVMHGKWRQCFQMDEESVTLVMNPKSMDTLETLGTIVSVAGLLAGKGADGMRVNRAVANAQDNAVSRFESVRKVKPMEQYDIIGLRGLILMNPIYVPKEDYDYVRDFINARVRETARS